MEKICIYPEQGAEITAYERALNCLIFMLVYLLAGILCMFLPVIFGIHGRDVSIGSIEIEGRSMDMQMHEIYSEQIA